MIKVYLYSDQYEGDSILAGGVRAALLTAGEFALETLPINRDGLAQRLLNSQPGVLLIDVPEDSLAGVWRDLAIVVETCKPVLWVESLSAPAALQAMDWGIRGVLRKTSPVASVATCIVTVSQGGVWFEKALTDRLNAPKAIPLTPRESQLVHLLSCGMKNKAIATALHISEGTVKVYLSKLYEKTGTRDRLELAVLGLQANAQPRLALAGSILLSMNNERRPQVC